MQHHCVLLGGPVVLIVRLYQPILARNWELPCYVKHIYITDHMVPRDSMSQWDLPPTVTHYLLVLYSNKNTCFGISTTQCLIYTTSFTQWHITLLVIGNSTCCISSLGISDNSSTKFSYPFTAIDITTIATVNLIHFHSPFDVCIYFWVNFLRTNLFIIVYCPSIYFFEEVNLCSDKG